MKTLMAVALCALGASLCSGGFVSGPCPPVKSLVYNASMSTVFNHYLLYMNKDLNTYLKLAEQLST